MSADFMQLDGVEFNFFVCKILGKKKKNEIFDWIIDYLDLSAIEFHCLVFGFLSMCLFFTFVLFRC